MFGEISCLHLIDLVYWAEGIWGAGQYRRQTQLRADAGLILLSLSGRLQQVKINGVMNLAGDTGTQGQQ